MSLWEDKAKRSAEYVAHALSDSPRYVIRTSGPRVRRSTVKLIQPKIIVALLTG